MARHYSEINYNEFRDKILFKKVVEWDEKKLVLDDGTELTIEMTDWDCCATAYGEFAKVKLDAAITDVSDIRFKPWKDGDTYGCSARIKLFHNKNAICLIEGDADAGNGGYYYSIASLIVRIPGDGIFACKFVGSGDGR